MNPSTAKMARTAGPIGRMIAGLSHCAAAVAASRRRQQTYRLLSSLDDRMLRDIGLDRTMLLGIAVHGVRTLKDAAPPQNDDPPTNSN